MNSTEIQLTEEQKRLIGRIVNWKFRSALQYKSTLKKKDSAECLELLNKIWENTGWGDGIFSEIITYLIEYIRMNEGYTYKQFYGEEHEEDEQINIVKNIGFKSI